MEGHKLIGDVYILFLRQTIPAEAATASRCPLVTGQRLDAPLPGQGLWGLPGPAHVAEPVRMPHVCPTPVICQSTGWAEQPPPPFSAIPEERRKEEAGTQSRARHVKCVPQ
jgi:hypothetical protein